MLLVGALLLNSIPASAQAGTAVSGVATDTSGNRLGGVTITLTGPQTYTATTADDGSYEIDNVAAGDYVATAMKGGYNAQRGALTVAAGQNNPLNVALDLLSLTTLKVIGSTSTTSGRAGFNTTPAAVKIISHQTFVDQGFKQVARVLDETPGIVTGHPGTSATVASPGAIDVPNIRGGLSFETASLIDGHPLAVADFGDYVTTFLNSNVLQDVELIKGPGAAAPQTNYAINGTVNFRTLDPPSGPPRGSINIGVDNFGGVSSNYYAGGTVFNGKLGYVFDYAVNGTPGPLQNSLGFFTSNTLTSGGVPTVNGVGIPSTNVVATTPGIQNEPAYASASLIGCCAPVSQTFSNKTELAKLRVNFSDATAFTATFLGSQTWTDQNGNHIYQYPTLFTGSTAGGYAGAIPSGSVVNTWQNIFLPTDEWEINNEPIFEGELRTRLFNDTVLARYYAASINRLQYNALNSPSQTFSTSYNLYGTGCITGTAVLTGANAGKCLQTNGTVTPAQVYNGGPYTVNFPGTAAIAGGTCGTTTAPCINTGYYFRSSEEDKLHGFTGEYDHLFGDSGNVLTFSYDEVRANSAAYAFPGDSTTAGLPTGTTVVPGSSQVFRTVLLRGIANTGKLNVTASSYLNLYNFTYGFMSPTGTANCANPPLCTIINPGFATSAFSHFDGRLGLVWRASPNLAVRASAGSSIAPPFLNLLDSSTTSPTYSATAGGATNSISPPSLAPETAMGYDFGSDWRLGSGIDVASADVYLTNVFNQFAQPTFISGTCTTPTAAPTNGTACTPGGTGAGTYNIYTSTYLNFGRSTYDGAEFSFSHDPSIGFGALAQGSIMRAYPDAPNPYFYCSNPPACTNVTNIAVIPGVNFVGSFTTTSSGAINSLSGSANTAIPYGQGYAEAHWRTPKGGLGLLGITYYGNNNSYGLPPFFLVNASIRFPIVSKQTMLQISADNLFNVYSNAFTTPYGGDQVNLVNGKIGLANANTAGPTTIQLTLTQYLGNH